MNESDDDFWDVGEMEGPRPARRRARRKSITTSNSFEKQSTICEAKEVESSTTEFNNNVDNEPSTCQENLNKETIDETHEPTDENNIEESTNNNNGDIVEDNKESNDENRDCDNDDEEEYLSSFESDEQSADDSSDEEKISDDEELKFSEDFDDELNEEHLGADSTDPKHDSVSASVPDVWSVEHEHLNTFNECSVKKKIKLKRKNKSVKLKWLSKSSSDIKSGTCSADPSEENQERFHRSSAHNDIGYPPKARLKNALYRGRRSLALKNADAAVEEFVRSYALSRIVHGDFHWRTCRCRVFLAQAYLYLKKFYIQAEEEARFARDILTRYLGTHFVPRKKMQVRHLLAVSHQLEGEARLLRLRVEGALPPLMRAEKYASILREKMANSSRQLPASMRHLKPADVTLQVQRLQAATLMKLKREDEARDILHRAVSLAEEEGGEDDPRLIGILQQLGELLIAHPREGVGGPADKDQASAIGERDDEKENNGDCGGSSNGDKISLDDFGQQHMNYSKVLGEDVRKGVQCFARAVHISKANNRPGSEVELDARVLLVRQEVLLMSYSDVQQTLRELHTLYTVVCRAKGEICSPAITLQTLTLQVLLQQGKYEEAVKILHKILKATKNLYGDYSKQSCNVMRQIWQVKSSCGDVTGQAETLSALLANEVLVFGSNNARTNTTREKLREALIRVPVSLRMKLERKHPELQVKPRFRNQ